METACGVGIPDIISDLGLSISPNPANDILYIDARTDQTAFEYKLFNMEGRVVDRGIINNGQTCVNTESMPQGTYLLQVSSEGVSVSKKVLIR